MVCRVLPAIGEGGRGSTLVPRPPVGWGWGERWSQDRRTETYFAESLTSVFLLRADTGLVPLLKRDPLEPNPVVCLDESEGGN